MSYKQDILTSLDVIKDLIDHYTSPARMRDFRWGYHDWRGIESTLRAIIINCLEVRHKVRRLRRRKYPGTVIDSQYNQLYDDFVKSLQKLGYHLQIRN